MHDGSADTTSNSTLGAVMLSVREADEVRYDFSGMDGLTILDDFKPDHKPVVVATLQKDMLCIYTGSQDHR